MVYQLSGGEYEGRWVYRCSRCGHVSHGSWTIPELAHAAEDGHALAVHPEPCDDPPT